MKNLLSNTPSIRCCNDFYGVCQFTNEEGIKKIIHNQYQQKWNVPAIDLKNGRIIILSGDR